MQGARRPHARLLRLAGGEAPGSHSSEAADMLVRGSNNPTCNTVEFSAERFSPQANEMSHTVDKYFLGLRGFSEPLLMEIILA